MRLALSSAAAPDLPLAELLEVCARRGLAGAEVQLDSAGHPLVADGLPRTVRGMADSTGSARLLALRAERIEAPSMQRLARTAGQLTIPVIAEWTGDLAALDRAVDRFRAAGATLLLQVGSDPVRAEAIIARIDALGADGPGLAWDVRPGVDDPGAPADILRIAGDRLRHVRLFGGGPESVSQTGQGVGALIARLTLARYAGPLVLTPSTPRYRQAWSRWLGRNGGWGCGSKGSDPSLVQISA